MRLYLAQHARALPEAEDPAWPLSDEGRADAAKVAAFLGRAGVRVEDVVHSGKRRAEQTATIFAETVWPGRAAQMFEGLKPNDATDPLLHAAQIAGGDVMAVGHMPFMGRLAARLLTGAEDGAAVAFEPGAVACFERAPDDRWALVWMVRPSLLTDP
ncbi:MAG: phosphohistidine phosphatase SixA [Alphaproteobacteria bacterium]|nr:phosphohistidine phosphatase SixA [Alphaproteobacteria bacterium]